MSRYVKDETSAAAIYESIRRAPCADATILGTNEKVPTSAAALVNGTMVRDLDANDIFVLSRGGPSGHFSDGTAALLAHVTPALQICTTALTRAVPPY